MKLEDHPTVRMQRLSTAALRLRSNSVAASLPNGSQVSQTIAATPDRVGQRQFSKEEPITADIRHRKHLTSMPPAIVESNSAAQMPLFAAYISHSRWP